MKKIRMFLPMLAVMVAVASALATATEYDSLAPVPVVINQTSCERIGMCTNEGTVDCLNGSSVQTYVKGALSCSVSAKGSFSNP